MRFFCGKFRKIFTKTKTGHLKIILKRPVEFLIFDSGLKTWLITAPNRTNRKLPILRRKAAVARGHEVHGEGQTRNVGVRPI